MIINGLTIKYTLANNWILRTDPYYESRKYSVYDITSRLTLYVTRSCYTLLKIFMIRLCLFQVCMKLLSKEY